MTFTALPPEIEEAIGAVVEKRSADSDEKARLLTRLEVLAEIGRKLRDAEREVVGQLREDTDITWAEIGHRVGRTVTSAYGRYGIPVNSVDVEKPARPGGVTVKEAELTTGILSSDIYAFMRKHPEASWFERVSAGTGKRSLVARITDLDALKNDLGARAGRE